MKISIGKISSMQVENKLVSIFICSSVAYSPLKWSIITTFDFLLPLSILSIGFTFVYAIFLCHCLYCFRKLPKDAILLPIFLFFVWAITFVTHLGYETYYIKILIGILATIPYYWAGRKIRDYRLLYKYLRVTAIVLTVSMYFWIIVYGVGDAEKYDQNAAYLVLPAIIISSNEFIERLSVIHLINIIVAIFLIFAAGARGPFVIWGMFIMVKLFLIICQSSKKYRILFIAISLVFIIVSNIQNIIYTIAEGLLQKDMSVRLLERLLEGNVMEDDARIKILSCAKEHIISNPFLGVGLSSDRIIISEFFHVTDYYGNYPHNFIYEIMLHYGIAGGGLFLLCLMYMLFISLVKNKDYCSRNISLMFCFFCFFPLLFSGSYLTKPLFFLFLGIVVSVFRKYRSEKYENEGSFISYK